jgi:hypothetical protein
MEQDSKKMLPKLLNSLPEGWLASNEAFSENFERQLRLELASGHPLVSCPVKIVAHRNGTDDILCWHLANPQRFTVVHLTWSLARQEEPDYPWVEMDGSWDDFLAYEQRWLRTPGDS